MPKRAAQRLVVRHHFSPAVQASIGVVVAGLAVLLRYHLPLSPHQLPTITTVVALAVVTAAVGTVAGVVTAVVGGALSWYFFFNSEQWYPSASGWIQLAGFSVIALVIVTSTSFFRSSEQQRHQRDIEALALQAQNAELFAREMAHRLKNALTIVQSLALQTFGQSSELSRTFAGRLKTIVEANELLNEHVSRPTADVRQVVRSSLKLFDRYPLRIDEACEDCRISDQQVISLAMAIHELGTNAIKYGAWSVPDGEVRIRIADEGECLRLTWQERGGPAVVSPSRCGFGSRLLQRAGRDAELRYEPDGLIFSVCLTRSA